MSVSQTFYCRVPQHDILYGDIRIPIMDIDFDDLDFEKGEGLMPVIVQDQTTRDVLTLAYCNSEALQNTIKTGKSWFWSRSRRKLWMKGETSGNTQEVVDVLVDCDSDALIYLTRPSGPACHTGHQTCFHYKLHEYESR